MNIKRSKTMPNQQTRQPRKSKTLNDVIKFEINKYIDETPIDAQNILIKNFNEQVLVFREQLQQQNAIILGQQKVIERQQHDMSRLTTELRTTKERVNIIEEIMGKQQQRLQSNSNTLEALQSDWNEIKEIKRKQQELYDKKEDEWQQYHGHFTAEFLCTEGMRMVNKHKVVRIGETKNECNLRCSAKLNHNLLSIGKKVFWRMRINGFGFSSDYYFIGVVSGQCKDFSVVATDGLCEAFGIHGGTGHYVFLGQGHEIEDESYVEPFHNGEVVRVEFDSGTLVFFRDESNEVIYSLELPDDYADHEWYPAISMKRGGDTCEIIEISSKEQLQSSAEL